MLFAAYFPKVGWLQAVLVYPAGLAVGSAFGVLWLWRTGIGKNTREFKVEGDAIRRLSDQSIVVPVWAETGSDEHRTDSFHGYSVFRTTLHGADGASVRNCYLDEDERRQELVQVLQTAPSCRALDLYLVWREQPLRWHEAKLNEQWSSLLCGDLTEVSPEARAWWRQWLRPEFPEDGRASVTAELLEQRLEELRRCYGMNTKYGVNYEDVKAVLARTVGRAEPTNPTIDVVTSGGRELMMHEAAPGGFAVRRHPHDHLSVIIVPSKTRGDDPPPKQILLRPAEPNISGQDLLRAARSGSEKHPEQLLRPGGNGEAACGHTSEPAKAVGESGHHETEG